HHVDGRGHAAAHGAERRGPHRRADHARARGGGVRQAGDRAARRPDRPRRTAEATGRMIWEVVRIALRGLRANKLRSALTTLGIIIGVSAVILLTALGNGIQTGFNEQFGSLDTQITITPSEGGVPGGGRARHPTETDLEALLRDAPDIATAIPIVGGAALLQREGDQYRTRVTGTTADYFPITNRELTAGRSFNDQEVHTNAKVVVLGPNPVNELFGGNPANALNQEIRIGRAVLDRKSTRLNSSHVKISYAVFCLKKKKRT